MSDPRGTIVLRARGKEFSLHLGMSALARLEDKHGQEFVDLVLGFKAPPNEKWRPSMQQIIDIFHFSLERFHAGEIDDYLVDDILSENANAFEMLRAGSMPEPDRKAVPGNAKRPRRAA